MVNTAFINSGGIIEQVYIGRQTFRKVTKIAAKIMILSDQIAGRGGKVKILVNITKVKGITADAMLAAADTLNTILESKIAVYGGSKLLNDLANLVIVAVGRTDSVMVFDTKKEAIRWLRR